MGRRGIKVCPKCGTENGVRSSYCKGPISDGRGVECNHKFNVKLKPGTQMSASQRMDKLSSPLDDWHILLPGDRIKVKAGSGPYWRSSDADGNDMNIPMGSWGIFVVERLVNDGIHAYHDTGKYHAFIYMGPKGISPTTGMHLRPHRIRKMRNGVVTDGDGRKAPNLSRK